MTQGSRPLLSIGMIVKNEERCLERCLSALQPLREAIPCQLVIADTGSTDMTKEIAARYADILFDYEWIGDFSAARNAVMDRCAGLWHLAVDADEYLDPDFHTLVELLTGWEGTEVDSATVCVRNYRGRLYDESNFSDFYPQRLVRMDTGRRYVGRIHETLGPPAPKQKKSLSKVIFHHDGYSYVDTERHLKKNERNMSLLLDELRRSPNDLVRILQCIESARDQKESRRYTLRGLRVIREGKSKYPYLEPIIYRYAIVHALDDKDPARMDNLLKEAEDAYPESIFIRLDAQAAAMLCYHADSQYERAAERWDQWEMGLSAYKAGDYAANELSYSTLIFENTDSQQKIRCTIFYALCCLARWNQAVEVFHRLDLEHLEPELWAGLVLNLFDWITQMPKGFALLQTIWDVSGSSASVARKGWSGRREFLRSRLDSVCRAESLDRSLLTLISGLDCEPGRSASILLTEDAEKMRHILEQVQCWDEVLYSVYPHLMRIGVPLPDPFYTRSVEVLTELASALPDYDQYYTETVLRFLEENSDPDDPLRLTWQMDLLMAALRAETWEEVERGEALCARFIQISSRYLKLLYTPDILTDRTIYILPGMYRYAWLYLQAQRALETGDTQGCLRLLRKGLEAAPAMKGMVEFLMEKVDRAERGKAIEFAPPELLTLAEQVKGLLAAYPLDDPAVQALKQSEAYQKVAFLIEEPAARWKM